MDFVWLLLIGIMSGIVAGMGMGGGTLLVPMLTILMAVEQRFAQGTNVLCFVFVGLVCGIIFVVQKRVNFKSFLLVTISGSLVSLLGAFFSSKLSKDVLKLVFGYFVLACGVFMLVNFILSKIKKQHS